MKCLLVYIDFSEASKTCLDYAIHLAAQTHSKLLLVSAFKLDIPAGTNLHSYHEEIRAEKIRLENDLKKLATQTSVSYHGTEKLVQADILVEKGDFAEVIKKAATSCRTELIVVTAKSKAPISGIQTSSDHVQLLKQSACPLLIVPNKFVYKANAKEIVYACGLSTDEYETIEKVSNMCAHLSAHLHCVHIRVQDKSETAVQQQVDTFKQRLGARDIHFKHLSNADIITGLKDYIQQQPADMLVMRFNEKSFFQKLFHVSKIKDMSTNSAIPLLLAKKNDPMPF